MHNPFSETSYYSHASLRVKRLSTSLTRFRHLFAIAAFSLSSCQNISSSDDKPREASVLAAVSPTVSEGIAGRPVENLPAVITQDYDGNPVAGVAVTFSVTEGSGVISGNVVRSNSDGIARLGAWRLGTSAGQNAVAARSGLLSQVIFRANAVAGPSAFILKIAGDQQGTEPGNVTAVAPQVRVTDAWGNGVAGSTVTFSVVSGGGSLTGNIATTDSTGIATVGSWRLGPRGNQSMTATAKDISPVTFTALSIGFFPCATDNVLPEGVTVHAGLTNDNCTTERIQVRITERTAYQFSLESDHFDAHLALEGNIPIAVNNDHGQSTNSRIKALLPAGVYTLIVSSRVAGAVGNYSLSFTKVSDSVEGCEEAFIVPGTVALQQTGPNDCVLPQSAEQADRFHIFLKAGIAVTVEVEDLSYSWHFLSLYRSSGELLATATSNGYVDTLSFTAAVDGFYRIDVSNGGDNGAQYRLTVR